MIADKLSTKKIILISAAIMLMLWAVLNYKIALAGLSIVFSVITPFIAGAALAFVINVFMHIFEDKLFCKIKGGKHWEKVKRPLSMVLSFLMIIFIIFLVITLVVPQLVDTARQMIRVVPTFLEMVEDELNIFAEKYGFNEVEIPVEKMDFDSIYGFLKNFAASGIPGTVITTAIGLTTTIVTILVDTVVAVIFAIYILLGKDHLKMQFKKLIYGWLPKDKADELVHIFQLTNKTFAHFVMGQCIEAVLLGTLCGIGMTILRIPYPGMVGVLVGFTALIPVFGAFIGTAIGAILILVVSPVKALTFVIFIFLLQQVDNQLFYPNIVGSQVGLPAMWTLVGVIAGGSLFGVVGMLLGVPFFSVCYSLLGRYTNRQLEKKNLDVTKI